MKNINVKDLCIVVLESPYDSLILKDARKIFSNMINTKLRGYKSYHEDGVMPVDTTDFIATHLIIANKNNPFEEIYMSYKSCSYQTCEKYNIPFPFMAILKNYAHKDCYEKMSQTMEECRFKNEDLSYDTGWTINPDIKGDKELQIILKEMVTTFVTNHHPQYNVPHWVTLGICKVKTDQMFLKMGLDEISSNAVFQHPFLHKTAARAVISMYNQYTDYVFDTAKKYQSLWDNRITISGTSINQNIKIAA
ncbi:MAG: hypothetical protein H7177_00555 [Rhizobacter sp.]|nr:hypothetical protein [Bacteriovorax sp.]